MSDNPKISTDWGMWDGIESSLEKKSKNRFLSILLGLPFLLIFAGAVGYLLAPNQDTTISNKIEIQRDTIYLTESIQTTDTIVKTEYITQWKYRNSDQNLALQSQVRNLTSLNISLQESVQSLDKKLNEYQYAFSENILKSDPKYQKLNFFKSEPMTNTIAESNNLIIDRSEIYRLAFSPLLNPKTLNFERPKIGMIHDLRFENLVKFQKSKNFFNQIIPDYVNIGVSVETPGLALTKNLSPGLEIGRGLNVELMFSPKFSFVTGVRTRSTQNQTSDLKIASTYPQPAIGPEEVFENLIVNSSFVDIPFTFKYNVFKAKRSNVYLTGGLLLSKHNQTDYNYEFDRNEAEIYYEEQIEELGWSLGSSVLGMGYEIDAWFNTSVFIESYARYNFNNESDVIHGVGFRFGAYYKI